MAGLPGSTCLIQSKTFYTSNQPTLSFTTLQITLGIGETGQKGVNIAIAFHLCIHVADAPKTFRPAWCLYGGWVPYTLLHLDV